MKILEPYRVRIDELDDAIVDLLIARTDIVRAVGVLKSKEGIPAVLPDRVEEVISRATTRAETHGLDAGLVRNLYTMLVDYSCYLEEQIMADEKKGHG